MKGADSSHEGTNLTRRDFIKSVGTGGGLVLFGQFGINAAAWALSGDPVLKMVLVDYARCTGCRTCETACSARNRPASIKGKELLGLGNPLFANIRVHSFNPDVDVPNVCAMCADTPCVNACPVKPGYHGVILNIDLSTGKSEKVAIPPADLARFVGGQGLGMKILWDRLKKPGVNPLSPENPLTFMPGPFSGLPVPSSSRTCVVTKSPITSPVKSDYDHASTVSYSNMGGFFGPEIRFAGYDGLVITGKAPQLSYVVIDDDKVEIREGKRFKGMRTDAFDKIFLDALGDRRFKTVYIGPAGENLVPYASILHTAGRAAGRGGMGCVMGSKNLKAIAVKGSGQPGVADHQRFLAALEKARSALFGSAYAKSCEIFGKVLSGRQSS